MSTWAPPSLLVSSLPDQEYGFLCGGRDVFPSLCLDVRAACGVSGGNALNDMVLIPAAVVIFPSFLMNLLVFSRVFMVFSFLNPSLLPSWRFAFFWFSESTTVLWFFSS